MCQPKDGGRIPSQTRGRNGLIERLTFALLFSRQRQGVFSWMLCPRAVVDGPGLIGGQMVLDSTWNRKLIRLFAATGRHGLLPPRSSLGGSTSP